MGLPLDFLWRFSSSHFLDSSYSFCLSGSSQKSGISLGLDFLPANPEDDLPLLLFTRVTGEAGVALLVGSQSTRLTSEASQLAGQVGGPNRDRTSMIPCQTSPHVGSNLRWHNGLAHDHIVNLLLVRTHDLKYGS